MIKKIMAVIATTVIALGAFTGCGKSAAESKDVDILNFKAPVSGEEIAVVKIKDFGTVKIKLFPDEVPKGVENFKGLVEKKYYDELIFHRVVGNFVIQTGDPKGNGTGGSSIWGEDFEPEINDGLRNFYGAVGYATGSTTGATSQFYINCGKSENLTDEFYEGLSSSGKVLPANVKAKYNEIGGAPNLDGDYAVFGQVIEGMDIVDKIAATKVDEQSKPLTQIIVETITIEKY